MTCETLPEPDPDASLLAAALDGSGLQPVPVPWDVDGCDAGGLDLCVFRSCWNAHERPEAFLAWVEARGRDTRFRNDAATVRWNFHKAYLLELEAAGVPVVPTRLFRRGDGEARVPRGPGWEDVVVKPAVSAASWRTHRFAGPERPGADECLRELLRDRDALVQPYQQGVEREGERAVIWIDGTATHAVRKSPRFAGGDESVSEARPVGAEEREIVRAAIGHVSRRFGEPLYARVDVMPDGDGKPRLSELELIEPSLFLDREPAALRRFVAAIAREAVADP